jgi:molybdopterin molybdotransferase
MRLCCLWASGHKLSLSFYNPCMSGVLPSYSEAATLVAERAAEIASPLRTERADLSWAAGRVLAEPLRADRDQPPFPRATRDGFACRADEASSHQFLSIAGATRAGQTPAGALPEGSAWEIMTGAAVPEGADAVVMIEHVEVDGGRMRLLPPRTVEAQENIVPRGAEARAGDEVTPIGTRMAASHVALAATCGYGVVAVFARPRVAILTTGDELVPVDAAPGPGQIRNSNAPMLAALVAQAGGEPWILPSATDDAVALDAELGRALAADLLLISGGVSAGKFDLVEPALAKLGARFHFTGVRIQPGKPLVFGELPGARGSLLFFGLPGNPISSAATFLLFAEPVLAALSGAREGGPRLALAQLARDVVSRPNLTRFVPAMCDFRATVDGLPLVAPVGSQGSGDLASFARSNCFLVVPEGPDGLKGGEIVRILLF